MRGSKPVLAANASPSASEIVGEHLDRPLHEHDVPGQPDADLHRGVGRQVAAGRAGGRRREEQRRRRATGTTAASGGVRRCRCRSSRPTRRRRARAGTGRPADAARCCAGRSLAHPVEQQQGDVGDLGHADGLATRRRRRSASPCRTGRRSRRRRRPWRWPPRRGRCRCGCRSTPPSTRARHRRRSRTTARGCGGISVTWTPGMAPSRSRGGE